MNTGVAPKAEVEGTQQSRGGQTAQVTGSNSVLLAFFCPCADMRTMT